MKLEGKFIAERFIRASKDLLCHMARLVQCISMVLLPSHPHSTLYLIHLCPEHRKSSQACQVGGASAQEFASGGAYEKGPQNSIIGASVVVIDGFSFRNPSLSSSKFALLKQCPICAHDDCARLVLEAFWRGGLAKLFCHIEINSS